MKNSFIIELHVRLKKECEMLKTYFIFLLLFCSLSTAYSEVKLDFQNFDQDQNFILDESELESLFIVLEPNIIKKYKLKEMDLKYAQTLFLYQTLNPEIDLINNKHDFTKYVAFDMCYNLAYCKKQSLSQIEIDRTKFEQTLIYFN